MLNNGTMRPNRRERGRRQNRNGEGTAGEARRAAFPVTGLNAIPLYTSIPVTFDKTAETEPDALLQLAAAAHPAPSATTTQQHQQRQPESNTNNSPTRKNTSPHPAGFGKRTRPQLLRAATVAFRSSISTSTSSTTTSSSRPPATARASSRRRRSCRAGCRLFVGAGEMRTSGSRNLSDGTATRRKTYVFRGEGLC